MTRPKEFGDNPRPVESGRSLRNDEPKTVCEMFERRCDSDPDATFLLSPDGIGLTYAEVAVLSNDLAAELRGVGLFPGSVVGIYQWNEPAWVVALLAAWWNGCTAALCGAQSPVVEARRRFELVGAKGAIVPSEIEVFGDGPAVRVSETGDLVSGSRRRRSSTFHSVPRPEETACFTFTSGTTGLAKPVAITHGRLVQAQRLTAGTYSDNANFRPRAAKSDKPPTLSVSPFGQGASMGRMIFRMYVGRPLILVRKFDVGVVQMLMERYRFDTLQLTPAMIHDLAYSGEELNFGSLKYVNCGTAPLPVAIREAFEDRFRVPVLQSYGSQETGTLALERYDDALAGLRGPGSVGRVTEATSLRIFAPDGAVVQAGVDGEIACKLPETANHGRSNASEMKKLPLDSDGWYHTGDLGHLDGSGILYVTGRIKEMMIVGGFNVYPAEVEAALQGSALITAAVVVPIPDQRLGEVAAAGVVWSEQGSTAARDDAIKELVMEVRALLEPYKVPRHWFPLVSLPLTPYGKLDRGRARELALESLTD
jgi:long-chain acyl-CoA synthetase